MGTTKADGELRSVEVLYQRANGDFAQANLTTVRVEELVASRPVREFRWYKGRRFYSGWYWSSTMRQMVAYESRLELARIMLADFDATVTDIAAQPFQLIGRVGSGQRRHVPDLLLRHKNGLVTVVDVKPARRLQDPKVAEVFVWTEQVVGSRGWMFEVWTGADEQLLDNVRFLAGYRRRELIYEALLPVALELSTSNRTVGALESALSSYAPLALARPVVLHLLWTRQLRAALDAPLSVMTEVQLPVEA